MSSSRAYTLYIGDLDKSVTQEDLSSKLKTVEGLTDFKINISKNKHNTKYAFVSYSSANSCEEAIRRFNHCKLNGVPMRVMWARPYKTYHQQALANIFVKGLPKDYGTKDFGDLFNVVGPVVSFKITHNSNGESLGYGYVQYEREKDAKIALISIDQHRVGENFIRCEAFKPRGDRKSIFNLKVSGFQGWDDEKLKSVFSPFGEIVSVRLFGKPTVYGFVAFDDETCGREAMEKLHNAEVDGYTITISRNYNRLDRNLHLLNLQRDPKSITNLYVKNFDRSITDEDFQQLFLQYGQLRNFKIERDNGVAKGFGYVNFKNHSEADRAVKELNGTDKLGAGNKNKKLHVAFFQYKCDRAMQTRKVETQAVHPPQAVTRTSQNPQLINPYLYDNHRLTNRVMEMRPFHQQIQGIRHNQMMGLGVCPGPYPGMNFENKSKMLAVIKNSHKLDGRSDEDIMKILDRMGDRFYQLLNVDPLVDHIVKELVSHRTH